MADLTDIDTRGTILEGLEALRAMNAGSLGTALGMRDDPSCANSWTDADDVALQGLVARDEELAAMINVWSDAAESDGTDTAELARPLDPIQHRNLVGYLRDRSRDGGSFTWFRRDDERLEVHYHNKAFGIEGPLVQHRTPNNEDVWVIRSHKGHIDIDVVVDLGQMRRDAGVHISRGLHLQDQADELAASAAVLARNAAIDDCAPARAAETGVALPGDFVAHAIPPVAHATPPDPFGFADEVVVGDNPPSVPPDPSDTSDIEDGG